MTKVFSTGFNDPLQGHIPLGREGIVVQESPRYVNFGEDFGICPVMLSDIADTLKDAERINNLTTKLGNSRWPIFT